MVADDSPCDIHSGFFSVFSPRDRDKNGRSSSVDRANVVPLQPVFTVIASTGIDAILLIIPSLMIITLVL
jgi:hypothetical protein